jgi:hypothetical protein
MRCGKRSYLGFLYMPVILRVRGYRCWFYEADLDEPAHVHVGKNGKEAKYWLNPLQLARPGRFAGHELREIERILNEYHEQLLLAWEREEDKRAGG